MDFFEQLKRLLGGGQHPQLPTNAQPAQRMPNGQVMVGGQLYPASMQEDQFNFGLPPQLNNRFQVQGAANPVNQLQRGGTIYTPGEGPRTNFRF